MELFGKNTNGNMNNSPINGNNNTIQVVENQSIINNGGTILPINGFCHKSFANTAKTLIAHFKDEEFLEGDLTRDMIRKNEKNRMDNYYYEEFIHPHVIDNFSKMENALRLSSMKLTAKSYEELGFQLTRNYLVNENKLNGIHEHIENVSNLMYDKYSELQDFDKDMVILILYHMYYQCCYGKK